MSGTEDLPLAYREVAPQLQLMKKLILKKIISKKKRRSMLQGGAFHGTKLGNSAKSEHFFPLLILLAWHCWNTALEVPYFTSLWHQGIFNKL